MAPTPELESGTPTGLALKPEDFVAEAARVTNRADVTAAAALYAPDGRMRVIFDGAEETHHGREQIRAAWEAYFPALRKHGFKVSKSVLAADTAAIVNDWSGGLAGRSNSYGLEVWKFREGMVIDHLLVGYLDIRPSDTAKARLRLGMGSPRLGISLLRANQAAKRSS